MKREKPLFLWMKYSSEGLELVREEMASDGLGDQRRETWLDNLLVILGTKYV